MKTFIIATLPSGKAAFTFDGPDWLAQARARWPEATLYTPWPICTCGLLVVSHDHECAV